MWWLVATVLAVGLASGAQAQMPDAYKAACEDPNRSAMVDNQCHRLMAPRIFFEKVPSEQYSESEFRARGCIPIGQEQKEWGCPPDKK